jgi:hypothetical protein
MRTNELVPDMDSEAGELGKRITLDLLMLMINRSVYELDVFVEKLA